MSRPDDTVFSCARAKLGLPVNLGYLFLDPHPFNIPGSMQEWWNHYGWAPMRGPVDWTAITVYNGILP